MLIKVILISILSVTFLEVCESLVLDKLNEKLKLFTDAAIGLYEGLTNQGKEDVYHSTDKCDAVLQDRDWLERTFDKYVIKTLASNLNPFTSKRSQIRFFLFKREFPRCGRELLLADGVDKMKLRATGFDPTLPTRILIHGWMGSLVVPFNPVLTNAYLKRGEFNVIVTDWSAFALNLNYVAAVDMFDEIGYQVARFTEQLHKHFNVDYDDIYLIGYSLGAQVAGAAGKHLKPNQYNTIFALDPAGPHFRRRSVDFRIDPTDAKYVESIQTSINLGLLEATGHATFYPNYGFLQGDCFYIGCSHFRVFRMFAESIVSDLGFWGQRCKRKSYLLDCNVNDPVLYRMGGEPSVPKAGIFYVKTNNYAPYALGIEGAVRAMIGDGRNSSLHFPGNSLDQETNFPLEQP